MKNSADLAPLVPVEKFSILLTVFNSNGTDVPPLVTKIIGLLLIYLKLLYFSDR
jgi:hypothetical protein